MATILNRVRSTCSTRLVCSRQSRFISTTSNLNQYKLTYFNMKARGEPIRMLFSHANIPFQDIRVEWTKDWSSLRSKIPWEKLPMLEDGDLVISQSQAILRYLSKKLNYWPGDAYGDAKADEYMGTMSDFADTYTRYIFEQDPDKKQDKRMRLDKNIFPLYLGRFNKIIEDNNGFLVGGKITGADFFVANGIEAIAFREGLQLLEQYPALKKHQHDVYNLPGVREWIAKNPRKVRK